MSSLLLLLAAQRARAAMPWYLAGGIDEDAIVAAYEPGLADDKAASLVNVADPGTHDATETVTTPFLAGTGWQFNTSGYLTTDVTPAQHWSAFILFDDNKQANAYLFGALGAGGTVGHRFGISPNETAGVDYQANGGQNLQAPGHAWGALAIGGNVGYRDGVSDRTALAYVAPPPVPLMIGGTNYNGTIFVRITANVRLFAVWNRNIGAEAMAAVYAAALAHFPQFNSPIICFGDSISNGVGASAYATRWAYLLGNTLSALPINAGINGTVLQNTATTATGNPLANNGRDTYAVRVTQYLKPGTRVIIGYGLNDLRYNDAAFTSALYANDLGEVIDAVIAAGVDADDICIGSPYYMNPGHYSAGSPFNAGTTEKHVEYVAAAAAVAAAKQTRYVDLYQAMLDGGGNTLIATDGIHPNDAGHALIADLYAAALGA